MNKYFSLFFVLHMVVASSLQGSQVSKMRVLVAAAGFIGATTACSKSSEWVKPSWAVKHLPNGVPKPLDDQMKFMKNPERFTKLGAELPRGLLLYGPPGTGKTSIARAISDELDATFIAAAGTDFTSRYYGDGSQKVRDLFATARTEARRNENGLVVVFIDELDVIVPKRDSHSAKGYGEQTTTLLTELDGFKKDSETKIYVIGATNCKDSIEPAVLRAGRLESHIEIPLPTTAGREDILRYYLKKIVYKGSDICTELAQNTEGMSGADLKKIINDAAIIAGSENASSVTEKHLRDAVVQLGESHSKEDRISVQNRHKIVRG